MNYFFVFPWLHGYRAKSNGRGFVGKENQFRELLIKTGMAVGGDNQISVQISPGSVEITYYHPTAGAFFSLVNQPV